MIGSFLISVLALLAAVFVCAWLKPAPAKDGPSAALRPAVRRQPALATEDPLPEN